MASETQEFLDRLTQHLALALRNCRATNVDIPTIGYNAYNNKFYSLKETKIYPCMLHSYDFSFFVGNTRIYTLNLDFEQDYFDPKNVYILQFIGYDNLKFACPSLLELNYARTEGLAEQFVDKFYMQCRPFFNVIEQCTCASKITGYGIESIIGHLGLTPNISQDEEKEYFEEIQRMVEETPSIYMPRIEPKEFIYKAYEGADEYRSITGETYYVPYIPKPSVINTSDNLDGITDSVNTERLYNLLKNYQK